MKEGFGLVLAGGGTKGAYEVGAWKALKELNINITAIVGTSIGAINGALFLQDDFSRIIELYNNIEFEDLVKISKENKLNEGNIFSGENIFKFTKEITKNKGLENAPMKELMKKYIDVEKIYNSKIEYGIVTASLFTKDKSLEVYKEDIKKEELYDYILASSCFFPIFKPQKIGKNTYYDGGIYDNIPINMLLKKDYNNIIVIDISNEGVTKKLLKKGAYIKIIKPNQDLGNTFDFDKKRINKNIKMGYLDTLKAFNKLQGHYYYFDIREFEKFLNIFSLKTIYGLELAAKFYLIDMYKVYNFDDFLNELEIRHDKYTKEYNKIKKDIKDIKILFRNRNKLINIINKGMGLCLFIDVVTTQPKYNNNSIVSRFFGNYKEAGEAIIELKNYMK